MEMQCKNVCVTNEIMDVNVVCMLQWFGPFESIADCEQWSKTHSEEREFNFYIVWGKKHGKGVRHHTLYCGKTEQKKTDDRFKDVSHPTQTLAVKEIWLARFSGSKLRQLAPDGKLKRGMHQYIECVEHGLINYFTQLKCIKGIDFDIENEKKTKSQPKQSLCIVNQWYDRCQATNKINKRHDVPKILPDVIYYDRNEDNGLWKESKRLTLLKR